MDASSNKLLRIGEWCVDPAAGTISRGGETARVETRVEARSMLLLLCLAERAGEVVSIDELLDAAWADVTVTPDSVYQAVTSLRRVLGDDPKQPAYIATVPRLGYRMVAAVSPWVEESEGHGAVEQVAEAGGVTAIAEPAGERPAAVEAPRFGRRRRDGFAGSFFAGAGFWRPLLVAACCAIAVVLMVREGRVGDRSSAPPVVAAQPDSSIAPARSLAVLPFLDLTEGMKEEEFADGMTEELIDRLSKIPGLRVPGATSSFYFKGKQLPVAEMARSLGVSYVLDGSVRKSGGRLRVAARLVRAENGYIVWTESYDRPFTDILMVQDDIAGEVTKALKASPEWNGR